MKISIRGAKWAPHVREYLNLQTTEVWKERENQATSHTWSLFSSVIFESEMAKEHSITLLI